MGAGHHFRRTNEEERLTARRVAEGRGAGRRELYRPWLTVRDFASRAPVSRIAGRVTGRVHHMMSGIEANLVYLLDMEPAVTDIREQFPLLSATLGPEDTVAIAEHLGVRHPRRPGASGPMVMTTDALVTFRVGDREVDVAYACKPREELEDGRVLEKLDIERHYWNNRGIAWWLVTEMDLPQDRVHTMRELHGWHSPGRLVLDAPRVDVVADFVLGELRERPHDPLRDVCLDADASLGLRRGTALAIARHAVAAGRWDVDLDVRWDPARPLALRGGRSEQPHAMEVTH